MSKQLNLSINLIQESNHNVFDLSIPINWRFALPILLMAAIAALFIVGYAYSALAISALLAIWLLTAWVRHLRSFDIDLDLSDIDQTDCVREMQLFE